MSEISQNEITFYNSPDGKVTIEVLYADENIWLTQKKMAELFETTPQNITLHLKHIYEENELQKDSTCKDYLQVHIPLTQIYLNNFFQQCKINCISQ